MENGNTSKIKINNFTFNTREFIFNTEGWIILKFDDQTGSIEPPFRGVSVWDQKKEKYIELDIRGVTSETDIIKRYPTEDKFIMLSETSTQLTALVFEPFATMQDRIRFVTDPEECRIINEHFYIIPYSPIIQNNNLNFSIPHTIGGLHFGEMGEFNKLGSIVTAVFNISCLTEEDHKYYYNYMELVNDCSINGRQLSNPISWIDDKKILNDNLIRRPCPLNRYIKQEYISKIPDTYIPV